MSVNAATPEAISEPVISGDNGQMEFLEISEEEVAVEEVPETRLNATDREYADEQFTVSEEGVPYSQRDTVPNTDPNHAYLAQNDVVNQGAIETEKEFRWYAFEIKEKSKITILLQMVETLDADLIMFSLDTETSTLNAINGSAAGGAGVTEYYANVLEPGIYYFTVTGYEGTGQFAFAFFQSSLDANYEVNDTSATATSVALDSSYMGIIDSPFDVDYYTTRSEKLFLSNGSIISVSRAPSTDYPIFIADINGRQKPNVIGKDIFEFEYFNGKFAARGAEFDKNDLKTEANGCHKEGTGAFCAQMIMLDNWQISEDYPW